MTLESLTVDQLAALCELERRGGGWATAGPYWAISRAVVRLPSSGEWEAWPGAKDGAERIARTTTEHAALLARHLNLTPKEDAVTTYKRIERTDPTYMPQAGDIWVFHDEQRWTVKHARKGSSMLNVGPPDAPDAHCFTPWLLRLTTHIERPVRAVTVPKEGYVPQVGDRLCGPDGPALRVSAANSNGVTMADIRPTGWTLWDSTGSFTCLVTLCHHIERDES